MSNVDTDAFDACGNGKKYYYISRDLFVTALLKIRGFKKYVA